MSAKDLLDSLTISSPCSADWESMTGNDRVRFCQHCNLSVHDLSKFTRKHALRLVSRSKEGVCLRYILLPDGGIKTKSDAPSLYQIGRHASRIAAGVFSATLTVSGAVATPVPFDRSISLSDRAMLTGQPFSFASNSVVGGAIRGFIFDPNGAVIPGATVALSNQRSKLSITISTNGDGEYRFDGLEPGEYTLKIEARGFASSEVTGITLRSDREDRIDQTLSIAAVEAEVEIQAGEVEIQGAAMLRLSKEPLVRAAQGDDLEAVRQLLAGKPDVNVRDKETNSTALEHAVLNANREMVQLLLWAGADVNGRDNHGRTSLMFFGNNITNDIVWDLINAGAKVNLRDNDGDTALIEAAACNNLEVLKALMDAGANVNAKNNEGHSALMQAASEGLVNNVKALILAGADVNARDVEGKTAWAYAAENNHMPVLRLLRSYGANEQTEPGKDSKQ